MVEILTNIKLLWPYALLLLPLPLFLSNWGSRANWSIPSIFFPRTKSISKSQYDRAKSTKLNTSYKFMIVWSLAVISLSRPVIVNDNIPVQQEGYDIVLALDLSASMSALDYSNNVKRISRLDALAKVLKEYFVKKRQGDNIAMVVFGKEAFLYVPLTKNFATINKMIDYMKVGMAGDSTSIGDAIGISINTLKNSSSKEKLIILLTDGQDNTSKIPPITAAKLAKKNNIRIYSIGMGKSDIAPIPLETGQVVMANMPIDEETLKEVSSITNGIYARARDLNELSRVYATIDELEKTTSINQSYITFESLHLYPLLILLAILIIGIFNKAYANSISSLLPKS